LDKGNSRNISGRWTNCNGLGPSSTQIIRPVIYRLSVKFEINLMKNNLFFAANLMNNNIFFQETRNFIK